MLIIGHRGAVSDAPENSLAALRAGADLGSDILEFDVRLTRDNIPVVIHDSDLLRTHKSSLKIAKSHYDEIAEATAKGHKIATLEEVLNEFFGVILLNLELKSRKTGQIVAELLADKYCKRARDWDNILISSFRYRELAAVRQISTRANLAMLHYKSPFIFVAVERRLKLSAVGFHRLHANRLAVEVARQAGLFTYAYTVNRPHTAKLLEKRGLDGIVTDYPDKMRL